MAPTAPPTPATLGQLRDSGWASVPVKEELRRNTVARIRSYMDIGVQGLIVEMPAPFDIETLRSLACDVRPQLG